MPGFVQQAVEYIRELPLLIKFLALVLSVLMEYIFPVFPGDTIVLLAGFLKAQGAVDLLEITLAVVIGSLLGALFAYSLGVLIAKKRNDWKFLARLLPSATLAKFNLWYRKWGAVFLLLNRFFPGIRALFFVAAGAIRLPIIKVLTLGCLSAILFNGCLILLGYWLGYNADDILMYFYRYNTVAFILLALVVGLFIIYFIWQKKRRF